jgi:hypothetical protein
VTRDTFLLVFPGQWGSVGLPAGQQQVLDRIESELEACEPRLRSMFAIFTRLTRDEGAPRTESLLPARRFRWTRPDGRLTGTARALVGVPLILGLVAFFVLAVLTGSAVRGCRPVTGPHAAATARSLSCQSAQQPPGRS